MIAYDVWANKNQAAFLLTDEQIMSRPELTAWFDTDIPPAKANSIRDLALQLGLDPDELEHTVSKFIDACNDKEFDPRRYGGKATVGIEPPKSNWATPLNQPPPSAGRPEPTPPLRRTPPPSPEAFQRELRVSPAVQPPARPDAGTARSACRGRTE